MIAALTAIPQAPAPLPGIIWHDPGVCGGAHGFAALPDHVESHGKTTDCRVGRIVWKSPGSIS